MGYFKKYNYPPILFNLLINQQAGGAVFPKINEAFFLQTFVSIHSVSP